MRQGFAFSTRFKVRYAEIDAQAVVFNSRYLEYADVAVTELWAWTGIADAVPAWARTEFHVRRSEIDYLKPFVWGDEIEAFVRVERIGGSSITKRFELCHALTGDLHCVISMVSVNVDLATHTSKAIPDAIRAFLVGVADRSTVALGLTRGPASSSADARKEEAGSRVKPGMTMVNFTAPTRLRSACGCSPPRTAR